MAPSHSLGRKYTRGNFRGDIQHQGSETAAQLLFAITLADAAPLQNGAAFFPDGKTRGSKAWSHTTQPNSQWLASCSIMHANSHKRTTKFALPFLACRGSQPEPPSQSRSTKDLPSCSRLCPDRRSCLNPPLFPLASPYPSSTPGDVEFLPAWKCPAQLLF